MPDAMKVTIAAALIASGIATRFDPGVMDTVVANRVRWHQIDAGLANEGYVALLDCRRLGDLVWLEYKDRIGGPYLVADCTATQHRAGAIDRGFAVDLSYEVAVDWGVVDDVGRGFKVWAGDPRPWELERAN